MPKGKKYDYRVLKNRKDWKVEIVRQATSSKTVVSKRQAGFATEAEAKEWAETELKSFVENLAEKNKRHAKLRELRDEKEADEERAALETKNARDIRNAKKARDAKNNIDDF